MGVMGGEVKGAWRINTFLFLLTGSQAVLLPWSPVILRAAGLSAAAVGLVMTAITLAGSIGVCGCLIGMKRTNSGAARRLMLLLLAIFAAIFHITAVLLLPTSAGGNTCMLAHTSSFGAYQNSGLDLSSNTLDSSLGETTSDSDTVLQVSTSSKDISTTLSNLQTQQPATTKVHGNTIFTHTFNTTNQVDAYTNTKEAHDKTDHDLNSGKHESSKNSYSESSHSGPDSSESINVNSKTTSTFPLKTDNTKDSHSNASNHLNTEDSLSIISGNQSLTSNIQETQKNSTLTSQNETSISQHQISGYSHHENIHESTKLNIDSTSSNKQDKIDVDEKMKDSSDEEAKNTQKSQSYSDYYDDYSYYEDSNASQGVLDSTESESVQHTSYGNGDKSQEEPSDSPHPPPPPPPPKAFKHKSGRSWMSNNHPVQSFDDPAEYSIQRANSNRGVLQRSREDGKLHLREEQRSPLVQPKHRVHQNQAGDESIRANYHHRNSYPGRAYGRLSHYSDRYSNKRKRSVLPRDQSLDPKMMNSEKESDQQSPENNESTEVQSFRNSSFGENASIYNYMESFQSPMGLKVGVALLLVLGSLLSAGIEIGVAQLWHCYAHGYDEGGVNQDILQRTITHTFQLSVYASHKIWSGLTSGAWVVGGGIIASLVCILGANAGVYGMLGGVHLALGLCTVFMVLVIPVPYGAVEPPKTRRPLSLYLDDEVLREGVRRLAFHIWVLVNGCLSALPITFGLWLIIDMAKSQGSAMAAQTAAVAVTLASESLTLHAQRWLLARVGLQGTMGVGGLALMLHLALMWVSGSVGMVVISHMGLGCSIALLWVSIRHNALLLATVTDQEREAWASWWCWRVGLCVGAAVWGSLVDIKASLANLFRPAAFIAASVAIVVATAAVVTSRRRGRTRRRVYHTLDLDMADQEEDDDDEDAEEDDWLVKRAKKEGINLG